MKTLITRIKRLALALCFVTPLVSWAAVDYTGTDYEPWSYSAGCVVWRGNQNDFHKSTIADVAADGTVGETYDLDTTGHSWHVFASNQSEYTSPGLTLVFDKSGYKANPDASFTPLSFGGLKVDALADETEGTPYSITGTGTRYTDFGRNDVATYFEFNKSFTVNRASATRCYGAVTILVAQGATFKSQAALWAEVGGTVKLTGEGTVELPSGLYVNNNSTSTLDLSAATRPTITGDVTIYEGGAIALPAGTEPSQETPFRVCSGTLTVSTYNYVKIGDADPIPATLTVSDGAITGIEPYSLERTFTSDYPTVVPAGAVFTFQGGTEDEPVVLDARTVNGTLKTEGYFSFTSYAASASSTLEVVSGKVTLNPGDNWLQGTLTVEAGATFVNARGTDAVNYNGTFTANIYGTLDMGATRWSLGANNTINLYEGCTVTGSGQGNNGALDWIENITGTLNVTGPVTITAPIKIRSGATVNVTVDSADNEGLTLGTTIGVGTIVKKGAGLIKFTTNPPYAITVESGAFTFAVDATPTITYSAKPGAGTAMSMWYAKQATWKGTVVIGALSAPAALPLDTYGNANSKIVLTGTTGNCYLNGTTTVAAELVVGANENSVVEFNNGNSNQVGTFGKVSGPGTLRLKAWTGCQAATYVLNTIDNFEGLAVANNITRNGGGTFTIRIGDIVTTRTTNPGDCVLPIVNTAVDNTTGTVVYDLANAKVNGTALDLEAKSDGIYVAVPSVDVTVPVVDNTVVTVTVGGETVSPKTEGGNVYSVAPGSVVTVTYAAADGYKISGTTEYTVDTATATTFEITDTATAQYVARVRNYGTNKNEDFTSLNAAIAVADGTTYANNITLLADITDAVTIDKSIYLAGQGKTISAAVTISSGGYLSLMGPTLTGKLTIGANGALAQVGTGSVLPEVETQDGASIALSTLSADTVALTVTTLTVNGTLTLSSNALGTERGTPYKAFSYVTDNATFGEGAEIVGGGVYSASTEVEGDNTVVSMTITAVAKIGDEYYDDLDEAVEDAIANDTVVELIIQPEAAVTLGAGETLKVKVYSFTLEVNLASGLTNPPYSISSDIDTDTTITTYTVNDVAPIKYFNSWSIPNVFYFEDEDPVPSRTTQGTVPKIKREGDTSYHAAEDWVTITWTVTASDAEDASTPDDTIATVDANGLVTFTAPGTVKVWLTMTDPSGATKSASKAVKYGPAPAVVVSADGQTKTAYSSLYAAFNGAATGEKIVLGADATVGNIGKMELKDGRSITLDLNGHTVTFNANYGTNVGSLFNIKSGSLAVVDTGATKGGIAATGTGARVFSMETAGEATTALSIGEGVNVSSAHEVCVYLQGAATLTTAGNLTAESDFAIAGNGSSGKGGTTVNVTGGTVTGDEIAIYQPQNGALTISGGAITGGTAVYVKSGTVTVTGGTITGNGAAADYVFNGSGANVTGDAIVIDNAGYPGGAPAPSITGGTFISVNASAIASYSKSGYSRITKFAAASLKTSSITETVASSADVFDDYSSGIDPTDPTSTQEVTVDTSLTAEEQEAAAIEAATVTVPDGVSGVDAATYKTYFTYSATPTATAGTYTVAITGLADEVTETADGNALAALEAATAGGTLSAEVAVKPGLYYGTVAGADVTTLKAPAGTLNTTGKLDLSGVTKPSTGEAFFIKIKVGTTAFAAEE